MKLINKIIIQLVDVENIESLVAKHEEEDMAMVGFHLFMIMILKIKYE